MCCGGRGALTIEVRGPNEGDVDAEVSVVGRAVEAEIDAEGDRGPGRVLLVAVEAYLAIADGACISRRSPDGVHIQGDPRGEGSAGKGAYLVRGLRLQLLEYLEGLLFGR